MTGYFPMLDKYRKPKNLKKKDIREIDSKELDFLIDNGLLVVDWNSKKNCLVFCATEKGRLANRHFKQLNHANTK